MGRSLENLEQFAIDVILERRHGVRATLLRGLLYALSFIYERLVQLRLFLYRKRILRERTLGCLVISIGNLTVGGTGKTPIVEKYRARFAKWRPARRHSQSRIQERAATEKEKFAGSAATKGIPRRRALFPMANRFCSIRSRPATSLTCSRTI